MINFSIFKKRDKKSKIKVDIHSHLLPTIDDGAKDIESSIELILGLKKLGYTKLITTPHIKIDSYPNTFDSIKKAFDFLQKTLEKKNIEIDIAFGAEYYVDENFVKLLNKKQILSFGENYILFEFSYVYKPINLFEIIYEIQESGYQPILAHPERYLYFHKDFDTYHRLKEQGVYLQLNLNSTVGYYSKPVQNIAKKLCDRGLIDFLGSDTHHIRHLNNLQKAINSNYYKTIFKNNDIKNDLI